MTNTAKALKASLLTKSTTEVQSLYDATEFALLNESYGSDDEARYDDMNKRTYCPRYSRSIPRRAAYSAMLLMVKVRFGQR